jgi:hypothetical protein
MISMENMYKYVGTAFIIIGAIAGIYFGISLKVTVPDSYGVDSQVLNPLRWVYGIMTIVSSVFLGSVILGIGDIIARLDRTPRS